MPQNNDNQDIDNDMNDEHNDDTEFTFEDVDDEGKSLTSVKKIREKLKDCEKKRNEYLDGWQRCKADSINSKKRDEELRIEAVSVAQESVLLSVLPVLDSFDMAFGNEEAIENLDPNWVAGMKHIQSQLQGILNDYGVAQIDPKGETFDPTKHESVEVVAVEDEDQDDKVLRVIQKGYMKEDKVLRAAKVAIGAYKQN